MRERSAGHRGGERAGDADVARGERAAHAAALHVQLGQRGGAPSHHSHGTGNPWASADARTPRVCALRVSWFKQTLI